MKQILKMPGYIVTMDDNSCNPYRLYRVGRNQNQYGYWTNSRTLVEKYADLKSCLLRIAHEM